MQEKNLAALLGSSAKLRILKLLLNNPDDHFDIGEISKKTKIPRPQVRSQIKGFLKIGLLKSVPNANKKKK